jgi:hypothetical protein
MNLTWLGFCNLLRSPLNLTWLCNKASWNLLRNLLRNPVEPDLALHQNNNNNNEQRTTKNKQPTTNNQQPQQQQQEQEEQEQEEQEQE